MKAVAKLHRPRARAMPEPVIALVDVVFFLLVFFMLVARMDASAPFDVQPPKTPAGENLPSGGMTVSISANGEIAVNGVLSDVENWHRILARTMQQEGATFVRLNADGAAPLGQVLPLVTALEDGAFGDVVLVVTPPIQ